MAHLDNPDETHARQYDIARVSGRNADSLTALRKGLDSSAEREESAGACSSWIPGTT